MVAELAVAVAELVAKLEQFAELEAGRRARGGGGVDGEAMLVADRGGGAPHRSARSAHGGRRPQLAVIALAATGPESPLPSSRPRWRCRAVVALVVLEAAVVAEFVVPAVAGVPSSSSRW